MYHNGNDEMMLCPYNRYHVVSKLRIQRHLLKCQKNHPNVKLATCFYNYSHKVRPEDMLKHYEICSHKTRMEGARYYEPGAFNPIDSSENNDERSFNFPNTKYKSQKDLYNCRQAAELAGDFDFEDNFGDSASDSDVPVNMYERNIPETCCTGSNDDDYDYDDYDDDSDDMKPLPLPKTVSRAFTCIKQHPEEHSNRHLPQTSQGRGFGRAGHFLSISSPRTSNTTDCSPSDSTDMDIILSEKKMPNILLRNLGSSCSASITSSMFEDTNTLKSQDIIFDDDDDDDVDNDADNNADDDDNGFASLLKDMDKYVKI